MNVLWRTIPKLLSAYDWFYLRSYVKHFSDEVLAVLEDDEDALRRCSDLERSLLVACVCMTAYHAVRNNFTEGAISLIPSLAFSLLRHGNGSVYVDGEFLKFEDGHAYWVWFRDLYKERLEEYQRIILDDLRKASPNSSCPDFHVCILRRLFVSVAQPGQGAPPLMSSSAREVTLLMLDAFAKALERLANPSLRVLCLAWSQSLYDSFWVKPPQR